MSEVLRGRMVLFLVLGCASIHTVVCYYHGMFSDICNTMQVDHFSNAAQTTKPPYKVEPDNITIDETSLNTEVEVTLRADPGTTFIGFMLEALHCNGVCTHSGNFTMRLDPSISQLLSCDGIPNRAVSQVNNQPQAQMRVKWRPPHQGTFFFRATVTRSFEEFWNADLRDLVTETTTVASTTVASTTVASTTVASTTVALTEYSTETTAGSTSVTSSRPYTTMTNQTTEKPQLCHREVVASLLSSAVVHRFGLPLLLQPRHSSWHTVYKAVCPFASGLTIAAFTISVKHIEDQTHVKLSALAGVAMCLCLVLVTLGFSLCGPSHELRPYFDWLLRLVALMNNVFTMAGVFIGMREVELLCEHPWPNSCLQWLMGAFVYWEVLFALIYFTVLQWEKHNRGGATSGNDKYMIISKRRMSASYVTYAIFMCGNMGFLAALLAGLFLCYK